MENVLVLLEYFYVALLIAAAVIDIRTHKIYPGLVYGMFLLGVLKIAVEIWESGMYFTSLWAALMVCGITTLIFWIVYRFSQGIGLGDVKLMSAAALFYSIKGIWWIVTGSMLLAALVGMCMVIKNRNHLKAELPFAPFVAAAALLRVFAVWVEWIW